MIPSIEALHSLALSVVMPALDCPTTAGDTSSGACTVPSRNPISPSSNELIYGLISFLVFFGFMAKFVLPRANQALADRRAQIEGKMESAEADRAAAEALLVDYRAQLADARGEATRIVEAAQKQGESIKAERIAQAQADAERIVATAASRAEAERQSVVNELRTEIGGLSLQLAERIVGASLESDERQRQLIDSFIAGVESGQVAESHAAHVPSPSGI